MRSTSKRAWIVAAVVVTGGSFAACDAPMHVLDTSQRVEQGTGGSGGSGGSDAGASDTGGGSCVVSDDGGTRTGDAREVRDMTHDEAVAWCENYIGNVYAVGGDGSAAGTPSIFTGYVVGSASYCWAVDGCVVGAGIDDCAANLLHAPCEATILQLNACLANFITGLDDVPNEQTCGTGCEAFMKAPHCSETVISKIGPPVADGAGGADECYLRTSPGCR